MKGILTKLRQGPWSALTVIVMALLALPIVGYFFWDLTTTKEVIAIVQAVFTILAIVAGGFIAAAKLQLFRDFEPHLTISQEVSHRFINNRYVHIDVTATVKNTSRVRVDIREGFFQVQQVLPVTNEEVERIRAQVFVEKKYDTPLWRTIDEASRIWNENGFYLEPGESNLVPCEFLIPANVESVLVFMIITNSKFPRGVQAPRYWSASTVYDIVKRPTIIAPL